MRKLAAICIIALAPAVGFAAASGPLTVANETGLTFNTTYQVNLQAYITPQTAAGKLSAQVVWSSVTYANKTFTDGSQSTGSVTFASTNILAIAATDQITVPSTALILGAPATGQITIVSTQPLVGQGASFTLVISSNVPSATVNIASQFLFTLSASPGTNWTQGTFSSNTATNLAAAINSGTGGVYTGTVVLSTGVAIACASSSTICNGYAIYSSTPAAISSGTMTGGVNPAVVTINGFGLVANKDFAVVSNSTTTANNLAAAINLNLTSTVVSTAAAGNIVFATATARGTLGNAYTMKSSTPAAVSVSSTNFSGGLNRGLNDAVLTFNGINYENGYLWTDTSNTSTGTAVSINAFLNNLGVIKSTTNAVSSVIFATATTAGAAGNAFTLVSSNANLTINSPTFLGGQDAATFVLNGVTFTAGVSYSSGTTTQDATNLAAAINASSSSQTVKAQGVATVMTTTSTAEGVAVNYTLATNATSLLTLSGATMTGGTNSGITLSTATITVLGHGFTKALQILYSGSPAIGGLTTGTTYFAILVDSNNIQLALTSTGAVAGLGIVITSTHTNTTANTYTLAPLAFVQGTAAGKWQVSNDGVNFNDYLVTQANVSVSSQTFTPVFPSTNTVQDFGPIDYGWLLYKASGPTSGGVALKVILNAKE